MFFIMYLFFCQELYPNNIKIIEWLLSEQFGRLTQFRKLGSLIIELSAVLK